MASKRSTPLDEPSSDDKQEQHCFTQQTNEEESLSAFEEEEESESEEGEETMDTLPEIQNPNSKPTPVKASIVKPQTLPPKSSAIKPSKKASTSAESGVKDKRVWSHDETILMLQGIIDYHSKNNRCPFSDRKGFYNITMKSLQGDCTQSQLYKKIMRLRKKFQDISTSIFRTPHEHEVYEVSDKIWGPDGCERVCDASGSNPKPSKVKAKTRKIQQEVEVEDFKTLYPHWNAGLKAEGESSLKYPTDNVTVMKKILSLIGEKKAQEMEEKWKVFIEEEEEELKRERYALLRRIMNLKGNE